MASSMAASMAMTTCSIRAPSTWPPPQATTKASPGNTNSTFTIAATEGAYYVEGQIEGQAGPRYAYSSEFSLTNRAPEGTADPISDTTFKAWAVDPDAETTPLSVRLDV